MSRDSVRLPGGPHRSPKPRNSAPSRRRWRSAGRAPSRARPTRLRQL